MAEKTLQSALGRCSKPRLRRLGLRSLCQSSRPSRAFPTFPPRAPTSHLPFDALRNVLRLLVPRYLGSRSPEEESFAVHRQKRSILVHSIDRVQALLRLCTVMLIGRDCLETWRSIHPYDKVAKEEGEEFTIAVVDTDARLNPFVAWRRHLDINAALPAEAPAFASVCRPGQSLLLSDDRLG